MTGKGLREVHGLDSPLSPHDAPLGISARIAFRLQKPHGDEPGVRMKNPTDDPVGQRAVELLADDIGGRAVGIKDNKIIDVSIEEAVEMPDHFDEKLFRFNSVLARF